MSVIEPEDEILVTDSVYSPSPWDEHQAMDGDVPTTGVVARAGDPLKSGAELATREAIGEALKTVYDPEIPVDIYELGLIYEINIDVKSNNVECVIYLYFLIL